MVRKIPFDSEILIFDFNVLYWFSLKKEAARGNFVKSKQKKTTFPTMLIHDAHYPLMKKWCNSVQMLAQTRGDNSRSGCTTKAL